MKLYNTLSRTKEDFVPIKANKVGMYSCGPTVYNYAHIGNLRTYIFMDLIRRAFEYEGYKVKSVMNITDVGHLLSDADDGEDKMAKASREQKKTPYEIAAYYTEVFFRDLEKLNIARPNLTPKATEHIPEMIAFVEGLLEKGYAYEIEDGIYFDIAKFPEYGKLSRADVEEQIAGARVEVNTGKRHPADFAVWKHAPKEHIMQWQSPWGMGYPGWHIECSAMSKKYLGETFDIHSGGVDHIPIHHENEIAQSQALTGKIPANYWMHGEFMLVNGGKMSKKLGNTYTVAQLEEMGYSPMVFRYFCLNAHYRKKLNFTFEGLDGAKVSYERLLAAVYQHKVGAAQADEGRLAEFKAQFAAAIDDDLNLPLALGILWTLVKEPKSKAVYSLIMEMDSVFGLSLDKAEAPEAEAEEYPEEVKALAEERYQARKAKNFALADELRGKIAALGYEVKDTAAGWELSKK
ncbi:MAG: cysteine--tRNA ligase [Clostridia bacterium]|nr:cysteine--tRNA ligase [Clostridia bacterium]